VRAFRGVTRITVTVVTIAFELTGQGAYILPTMVCILLIFSTTRCLLLICFEKIVVMVTKSVGDWFGKGGIADQMIRFNGFPFLEKEDQPFNVPGTFFFRLTS
jgi:chloride channel 3/4/5